MTSKADSIYCSGLLPVLSIEAIEKERGKPLPARADPADNPERALQKKVDADRIDAWVRDLPPDLAEVGIALLNDDNQATIARRLKVSEAAISKRVKRLLAKGRIDLSGLRRSAILT